MAFRPPHGRLCAAIRARVVSPVLAGFTMLLLALPAWSLQPPATDAPEAARAVREVARHTLDILHDANLDTAARQRHMERLLCGALDLRALAEFTLGRHRGGLSEEQRKSFRDHFGRYVVATYARRISRRALASIDIVAARQVTPHTAAVSTRVVKADGAPLMWTWRMLSHGERYRIVDLQMAGTSMAVNYRSEIGATLSREGFEAVLRTLQSHLAQGTTMHADRSLLPRLMGTIAIASDEDRVVLSE